MTAKEIKAPPPLGEDLSYNNWKHEVKVWEKEQDIEMEEEMEQEQKEG